MNATAAPLPQQEVKPKRTRKTKVAERPGPMSAVIDVAPVAPLAVIPSAKLSAIVEPAVTAAQAVEGWKRYQEICRNILEENDYIYYVRSRDIQGKENKPIACRTRKQAEELAEKQIKLRMTDVEISPSKKRSAWDKLARFYNLSVPSDDSGSLCATAEAVTVGAFIVERLIGESFKVFIYQDAGDLKVVKVSVLLKIVAPNGRTVLGDGACAVSERRSGADSFAHADHDVFSTAFTRAFNRGVSRCIGTGEVSAEEFEAAAPNGDSATTIASAPVADISTAQPVSTVTPPAPVEKQENAPPATQAAAASEPTTEAAKPPRAEIPTELPQGKQASFSSVEQPQTTPKAEAANTQTASVPSGFKPLAAGASNKDRFRSIYDYLYGKNVRIADSPGIAYLIFSVAPLLAGPFVITNSKGKVDLGYKDEVGAFTKAMRSLPDLQQRLTTIETVLSEKSKEQFLAWANALVESAKGRGVFGK